MKLEKPHICITSPDFTGPIRNGGVGTACFHQARNLSAKGYRVTVVFSGNCEAESPEHWRRTYREQYGWEYVDLLDWAANHLPPSLRVPTYPPSEPFRKSRLLLEYLKTHEYDLVYFQDYLGHALYPLYYKRTGLGFAGTEFCITIHSCRQWILDGMRMYPGDLWEFTHQQAEIVALRLAENLVAPSQYMANWISRWVSGLKPVQVVPYCFDPDLPNATDSSACSHGPFHHLVFFGRLETRKGLHLFLQAVATSPIIRDKVRRITFLGKIATVEGQCSEKRIARDLAGIDGIEWEIIDNFNTHQALAWLKSQDGILVIAPSLSDNLPLAIIELFTNRLPFLTTDVGGIPEIVGPENPHLTAAPDTRYLRAAMETTLAADRLKVFYSSGFNSVQAGHLHVEHVEGLLSEKRPIVPPASTRRGTGPAISVIMPHYNAIGYLRIALDSLLRQDIGEAFEIILVDDCSDVPGIESILETLLEDLADERIKLVRMAVNSGPSAARNMGIRHATGEYLVFFDADNEALPHMLAFMLAAIRHSGMDTMTCFNRVISQDDRENPRPLDPANTRVIYTPLGNSLELAAFVNVFGDTCSIMRKPVPKAVGGWPEEPDSREDWEFFAKVSIKGFALGVIPEVLYLYRDASGSRRNLRNRVSLYTGQARIMRHLASADALSRINYYEILLLTCGMIMPDMSSKGEKSADLYSVYDVFAQMGEKSMTRYLGLESEEDSNTISSTRIKTILKVRHVLTPRLRQWERRNSTVRIMLYGAGDHSKVLLGVLPSLTTFVVGFIDTSLRERFMGLPCLHPTEVSAEAVDVIVYSSAAHELAMYQAMRHLDVEHVLLYHAQPLIDH